MIDDVPNDDVYRRLAEAEAALDAARDRETSLREGEERYRSLFQRMGQGYCELELVRDETGRAVDQRYIAFNPAFERLFGIPVAEAQGRTASEVFPGLEPWWHEAFDRIARHGRPERIEHVVASLDRAFEVFVYPTGDDHLTVMYEDVTARRHAELALRASEERQAFLLKLSDLLRPLRDASEARAVACRLLGEHLSASRAYYVEYQPEQGYGVVADDYLVPGLPSLAGRYPFEAFRSTYERIGDGRTWIVPDVTADEELPEQERTFYAAQGVVAWVNVPLAKDGILEAALCVVQTGPRDWTALEITLVEETAERLWAAIQRARAEAGLRESERRFSQFAASSSDVLWIRDASTWAFEYVSPAVQAVHGVSPDAVLADARLLNALIVPEERERVSANVRRVSDGAVVVQEYRIQRPTDLAFRWIRSTGFPLHGADGRVERIGAIAQDITDEKLATEHTAVLLAELQHRVRNIMAMIRSITARTGERAESVPDYAALLAGRLLALARVQTLLTRAANASVSIGAILHDEVSVQAEHKRQYDLDGHDIALSPKAAEVLTMAIHELATNALKYGALSVPEGKITVRWTRFERRGTPWLSLDWSEEGAPERAPADPSLPRRRGFGSELIEGRIPYELGGRGKVVIEPGGARCHLEFPLREGDSILETDAPRRATVFGGALDMSGQADLSGHRILVVEDDYYLATDTARAVRGAGAEVLGPCPNEDRARDEIEEVTPTGVILDINTGAGASFTLANELRQRGVPFIFVTGYDMAVIPAEFDGVERLQKPVDVRQIVGTLAKVLGVAA